jgi:acetylornithine deacetylase/succinyl-diaminopimelate desuccinylase-like protein
MTVSAAALVALGVSSAALAAPPVSAEDKALAKDILEEIVSIRTAKGQGQTGAMAQALADRLMEAGFSRKDIDMPSVNIDGETVTPLIVRYRAEGRSKERPIALLAHMDVVDASAETWETEPYEPVVKDGYLYGRGAIDNKAGIGALITTFIRLKEEGWSPNRDLVIAFSADEETGMQTTKMLTKHKWVRNAEFALNSDAGAGSAGTERTKPAFSIQSAEKTYATFLITARNPGGHSSAPRPDNAIYDLVDAIDAVQQVEFPVEFNPITRAMTETLAAEQDPEVRDALMSLLNDPSDASAREVVQESGVRAHFLSTTCVPTMLDAGSAENALPQKATVTVNCRIMPGTSPDEIQTVLTNAISNPDIEIRPNGERTQSPVSPIREDLFASITSAVHKLYPDATVEPSMSSGGTDGREFRSAGIPTYGAGAIALGPDDRRAHGINERVPLETYYLQTVFWETLLKDLAGGA